MVGTGRIELPTSSVSRKRSPTELRACRAWQDDLRRAIIDISYVLSNPRHILSAEILDGVQEPDFLINSIAICQLIRLMDGALFCNQTKPR
jgi:hypothetical protein